MIAHRVGEAGFVRYLHELRRLRVLSQAEVLAWLQLHGSVVRLIEPPLDDGSVGINEETFAELEQELGPL